jgi:serine O-acetyltransferase
VALTQDSYWILALWRLRVAARRWHIPFVNHLLRRVQSVVFGIELGNGITLGRGVYFLHPIGIVVGGDARIGNRVRLMGSNTVGTAKDNGYPVIGDEVVLGAGARVLGPVRVGDGAVIGANAVVLSDVPAGGVAVGVPARVVPGPRESPRPAPPAERT